MPPVKLGCTKNSDCLPGQQCWDVKFRGYYHCISKEGFRNVDDIRREKRRLHTQLGDLISAIKELKQSLYSLEADQKNLESHQLSRLLYMVGRHFHRIPKFAHKAAIH